jgi:hypothetical protein
MIVGSGTSSAGFPVPFAPARFEGRSSTRTATLQTRLRNSRGKEPSTSSTILANCLRPLHFKIAKGSGRCPEALVDL